MLTWIWENIATIIICIALLLIVTGIIAGMIRDKRKGKSSCGCASCPMSSSCHKSK